MRFVCKSRPWGRWHLPCSGNPKYGIQNSTEKGGYMRPFENRTEAGRMLGEKISGMSWQSPVVLALPRGGIPVAAEVAKLLGAPLDILAVKKIGAPHNPELALGAVSEDEIPVYNDELIAALEARGRLDRKELQATAERKVKELRRQVEKFRQHCERLSLEGCDIVLVDDGLATGSTVEAAIHLLRTRRVGKIVVAVPVAAPDSCDRLREKADGIIALLEPEDFYAVGAWYCDFSEVTDGEAIALLEEARKIAEADPEAEVRHVRIPVSGAQLPGDLSLPKNPFGLVIFAHGSGSSRQSPRNRKVADSLAEAGVATLLFDLLTPEEAEDRTNVFDLDLLATRLASARAWCADRFSGLPLAYFGASTGAAAALVAAAREPGKMRTVVSRGGRPDLAGDALPEVDCPVLLIVGGEDGPVIPLNRSAASHLQAAELVIVPGAGHLFEEPGALEEVIRLSRDWLLQQFRADSEKKSPAAVNAEQELRRLARDLRSRSDLEALAARFADRRVVMLGESSHGTQEFYSLRRELSQILIERHGFHFIAVEGDWPDCQRYNDYIHGGQGDSARRVAEGFQRWPTWMWANEETVKLVEWMRGWEAGFFGLDVYSLYESLEILEQVARRMGIELSRSALALHACFAPFRGNEIAYARSLLKTPEGCRKLVLETLRRVLELRLESVNLSDRELFDAQQNARVVRNAERYYRAMLEGDASSWNVRDQHMMETLDLLLERHGESAKAIVWAHNTHIGDYHYTDMIDSGYVNLGGLARERYGRENVALIGFTTHSGHLLAGKAWGAPEQVMELPPGRPDSLEEQLHRLSAGSRSLSLCFDERSRRGPLAQPLGHRAVGVVYDPAYEITGHNYVPTVLPERYDAVVYVDQSHALSSLHRPSTHGLFPETWPSGT
jgi:putative phosphoribosyl transferase